MAGLQFGEVTSWLCSIKCGVVSGIINQQSWLRLCVDVILQLQGRGRKVEEQYPLLDRRAR